VVSGGEYMTTHERLGLRWEDGRYKDYDPEEYPVRHDVYDAFQAVRNAVNRSGMMDRSLRLDKVRSKPYWSTDIEMAARAFERYV
ncbi:TPA: hypothetical protein N2G38_005692, partial [Salmonella enterica]|nr:hypothetical protein [Salmonella enterica]